MSDSSEPTNTSKLEKLIARYEEFHQHSTNKLIHYICVPTIAFSLIGLLWCIKIADIAIPTTAYFLSLNVGVVFICLAAIYYLSLSLGSFLGMMFFGLVASVLCISFEMSPVSLFAFSLVVFVLAWVGQFIGHHIEGERPAFTEDLQFLLVSPAWILDALYNLVHWGFRTGADDDEICEDRWAFFCVFRRFRVKVLLFSFCQGKKFTLQGKKINAGANRLGE